MKTGLKGSGLAEQGAGFQVHDEGDFAVGEEIPADTADLVAADLRQAETFGREAGRLPGEAVDAPGEEGLMAGKEQETVLRKGPDFEHGLEAEVGARPRIARIDYVGIAAGDGAELIRVGAAPEAGGGSRIGKSKGKGGEKGRVGRWPDQQLESAALHLFGFAGIGKVAGRQNKGALEQDFRFPAMGQDEAGNGSSRGGPEVADPLTLFGSIRDHAATGLLDAAEGLFGCGTERDHDGGNEDGGAADAALAVGADLLAGLDEVAKLRNQLQKSRKIGGRAAVGDGVGEEAEALLLGPQGFVAEAQFFRLLRFNEGDEDVQAAFFQRYEIVLGARTGGDSEAGRLSVFNPADIVHRRCRRRSGLASMPGMSDYSLMLIQPGGGVWGQRAPAG